MNTLKILIADDHPIFLKGLKEVLEAENDIAIAAQAPDGEAALHALQNNDIDIAILDIDMPKLNGLQVAEQILQTKPLLPVILLTMHKGKDAFVKALEIGISGYVLKENAVIDLIHAIRNIAGGNHYISPEMSAFLKQHRQLKNAVIPPKIALLTASELKILQMIANYHSTKDIADALFISEKTVSNHRMNMARKLELTGKNSLLRFAIENL